MRILKKNDEFETEIIDMSNEGEGIGHADGMAFFIKGAVVGDVVLAGVTKLKKTYGYARIVRILKPSPNRIVPACPIAGRCGGCTIQQINYSAQLEFKQKKVIDALVRIGGIDEKRFVFDDEAWEAEGYPGKEDLRNEASRDDDSGNEVSGKEASGDEAIGNDDFRNGDSRNEECSKEDFGIDPRIKTKHSGNSIRFYNIIGMQEPFRYRNKGQFPVGTGKDGKAVCGFYAKHSHDIIDTKSCLLQHDLADALMLAARGYLDDCLSDGGGTVIRHILTRIGFTTHEVMVCAVISADELPYKERFIEALCSAVKDYNAANGTDYCLNSISYNINKENTNVILGEKVVTIAGLPFITDYIGDIQYRISPLSFYQVNPVQTEELYATALEFADPDENDTVWDLYCGIGTISLYFAKYVKRVYGIEIVPQAIEDAKENAKMNGITNAEFMCGAAEELFPERIDSHGKKTDSEASVTEDKIDIIVVDPPRKGCDAKLIECIGKLAPEKIVYVSCDPATLARDIKLLGEFGYEPVKVRPVDMFPQTVHVETVVLLTRQNT